MDRSFVSYLIFFLVVFVILPLIRQRGAKKGKERSGRNAAAPARTQAQPVRRPAERTNTADYGEASHRYSHLSAKREEQLKSYLRAGLIDQKEYRQMLERYTQQENCFDDQ